MAIAAAYMQKPPTQLWPNPQTDAQAPQLFASVEVFVSQPVPTL